MAPAEPTTIDCDVGGLADPDVSTIDVLARLQLAARRLGYRIRLCNASRELQELLAFMGLEDAVPCRRGLVVEAERQPEEREQRRGVQERVEPDDPTP
jgi:hypothetical protein